MFVRFSAIFSIAALVSVAVAVPNPIVVRQGSSCDTGSTYCCEQIAEGESIMAAEIAEMFGFNHNGVPVGVNCISTNGFGGSTSGGNSCDRNPVCCNGNTYNQHSIVTECSPITINCNGFNFKDCTVTESY